MRARAIAASSLLVVSSASRVAAAAAEHEQAPWGGPTSQHFWLDARAGVESVWLETVSANLDNFSVGILPTSGTGPTASVGTGVRFGFLTLGARGRVASFQEESPTRSAGSWQIWTLDAELGLRIPLGTIEPHLAFAGGYTSIGGVDEAVSGLAAGLDVHGVDARMEAGVDFWVTHALSLGVTAGGALMALARPGVSLRDLGSNKTVDTLDQAKARVLEADGSSTGAAVDVTGNVGLHF